MFHLPDSFYHFGDGSVIVLAIIIIAALWGGSALLKKMRNKAN